MGAATKEKGWQVAKKRSSGWEQKGDLAEIFQCGGKAEPSSGLGRGGPAVTQI